MNDLINAILTDLRNGISNENVQHFYYGKITQLSDDLLLKGVLMVSPVSTSIRAVTTGLTDEETNELEIVLVKSIRAEFYKNAQQEAAAAYLIRVMDKRNADKSLQTNSVRYIVRNRMRSYGINQVEMVIDYNTEDSNYMGAATATMKISQVDHQTQPI